MRTILIAIIFTIAFANSALSSIVDIRDSKLVSVIYVHESDDLSPSSFGHIALRFSKNQKPGLFDSVVEFVADDSDSPNAAHKLLKGIGVPGFSFDINVKANSYLNFQQSNLYIQNRDVDIIELNLSPTQIYKLETLIGNLKNSKVPSKYGFFYKNCSYYALDLIEEVAGISFSRKSHPWKTIQSLEEFSLIRRQKFIQKSSSKMNSMVEKSIKKFDLEGSLKNPRWINSFKKMILNQSNLFKLSSYYKLLESLNTVTSRDKEINLKKTLLTIKSHEPPWTKKIVDLLFTNKSSKKVIEVTSQEINSLSDYQIIKHDIDFKDNDIIIKVILSKKQKKRSSKVRRKRTVTFKIPGLHYNNSNKTVSYQKQYIGRYIQFESINLLLSNNFNYSFAIDNNILTPYVLIDLSNKENKESISARSLNGLGVVAINNRTDLKDTFGACLALVNVQKALLKQAVFIKSEVSTKEELTSTMKINLIKEMLNDKYAVIYNYSNITDFTNSINKEDLKSFLIEYQYDDLNKNPVQQFKENILKHSELNSLSLESFKSLLKEGVHIPLILKTFKKNSNQLAHKFGHAILVYQVYRDPQDNSYTLHSYDPNFGVSIKYKFDKDFNIIHDFYSKEYDIRASFIIPTEKEISLSNFLRNNSLNKEKVISNYKTGSIMNLSEYLSLLQEN